MNDSAKERGSAFDIALRPLGLGDPLRWIARGWRDFMRAPAIGLFYGACFVAMGWALMKVYENAPAYVLALSAGFLLMGPFLCMGLYQVSRQLERGEPGVMILWGALITVLVVAAMLPWFAGLLVASPVLGHASWHAYRAAVGGYEPTETSDA
jgi:uncharacterized membrane protein